MPVDADPEAVLGSHGMNHPNHSVELEADLIPVVGAAGAITGAVTTRLMTSAEGMAAMATAKQALASYSSPA